MKNKKTNTISILFTLLVIAFYLIPNFATAMQVELNQEKYKRTDKIIFNIKHPDLKEKITNVTLFVDDSLVCNECDYAEIHNYNCEGYGYGYGYGCGSDSFEAELIYSFDNLEVKEHSYEIILNSEYSKSGKFTIGAIEEAPFIFNITNPTDNNITKIIILPNNIVIDRVIPPDKQLMYVETKEGYIIIPEFDVIFEEVLSTENNIDLIVTSDGYKCFDIYTAGKVPESIKINGTAISFSYNSTRKIADFCTNFSTKRIKLSWILPPVEKETSGGSSGGGGGGGGVFANRFELNKPVTRMLVKNAISRFLVNSKWHTFKVIEILNNSAIIEIDNKINTINLTLGLGKTIDVYGIFLEMTLIRISGNIVFIKFEKLSSGIAGGESNETTQKGIAESCDEIGCSKMDEDYRMTEEDIRHCGGYAVGKWKVSCKEIPEIIDPIEDLEVKLPEEKEEEPKKKISGITVTILIITIEVFLLWMYYKFKKSNEKRKKEKINKK